MNWRLICFDSTTILVSLANTVRNVILILPTFVTRRASATMNWSTSPMRTACSSTKLATLFVVVKTLYGHMFFKKTMNIVVSLLIRYDAIDIVRYFSYSNHMLNRLLPLLFLNALILKMCQLLSRLSWLPTCLMSLLNCWRRLCLRMVLSVTTRLCKTSWSSLLSRQVIVVKWSYIIPCDR